MDDTLVCYISLVSSSRYQWYNVHKTLQQVKRGGEPSQCLLYLLNVYKVGYEVDNVYRHIVWLIPSMLADVRIFI